MKYYMILVLLSGLFINLQSASDDMKKVIGSDMLMGALRSGDVSEYKNRLKNYFNNNPFAKRAGASQTLLDDARQSLERVEKEREALLRAADVAVKNQQKIIEYLESLVKKSHESVINRKDNIENDFLPESMIN